LSCCDLSRTDVRPHEAPPVEAPSPGGQVSGMGERHPVDLPEGYHAAPRAQGWQHRRRLIGELRPGCGAVGLRQVSGMPQDPLVWARARGVESFISRSSGRPSAPTNVENCWTTCTQLRTGAAALALVGGVARLVPLQRLAGACPRRTGRSRRWPKNGGLVAVGLGRFGISSTSTRATTRHPGRTLGRIGRWTCMMGAPGVARGRGFARSRRCRTGPVVVEELARRPGSGPPGGRAAGG